MNDDLDYRTHCSPDSADDWDCLPNKNYRNGFTDYAVYARYLDSEQARARSLCGDCPLLQACARYALAHHDTANVSQVWNMVIVAGIPFAANSRQRAVQQGGYIALAALAEGYPLERAQRLQTRSVDAEVTPWKEFPARIARARARFAHRAAAVREQAATPLTSGGGSPVPARPARAAYAPQGAA
ncbi:WhiB family transcriptional regulator [Corynebacterium striatum]|uniref:WhiB family transcriptional regulator n=1 Tax=Corynebacterium striatum TaxID=43770 RepID=UPI00191EF977|nr:hypothetical protein [Corynebacterium striatum]QQU79124.1 WhiB family transcriptional regulator [Corynebacterium striatum]